MTDQLLIIPETQAWDNYMYNRSKLEIIKNLSVSLGLVGGTFSTIELVGGYFYAGITLIISIVVPLYLSKRIDDQIDYIHRVQWMEPHRLLELPEEGSEISVSETEAARASRAKRVEVPLKLIT